MGSTGKPSLERKSATAMRSWDHVYARRCVAKVSGLGDRRNVSRQNISALGEDLLLWRFTASFPCPQNKGKQNSTKRKPDLTMNESGESHYRPPSLQ